MNITENEVKQLIERTEKFVDEVLPQAGKLSIDIGNINELCILISQLKNKI